MPHASTNIHHRPLRSRNRHSRPRSDGCRGLTSEAAARRCETTSLITIHLHKGDTLAVRPHLDRTDDSKATWVQQQRSDGKRIVVVELSDTVTAVTMLEAAREPTRGPSLLPAITTRTVVPAQGPSCQPDVGHRSTKGMTQSSGKYTRYRFGVMRSGPWLNSPRRSPR